MGLLRPECKRRCQVRLAWCKGDYVCIVAETNTSNASAANTFSAVLHEDNLAARFADYTLNQDVSFVGFRAASTAASTTVNVKADSVKDTVGAWDAVNGEYEVKSAGDYTAIIAGKVSSGSSAVVYKNGVSTGYQIGTATGAAYTLNGTAIIPNCIIGDKLSIRTTAAINLTDTYLSFSKRATSQQLFAPTNVEVGIAQNYVDVTASRASGVTYTNNTSRPIMVHLSGTSNTSADYFGDVTVGGVVISIGQGTSQGTAGPYRISLPPFMVPPAKTYSVIINSIESLKWVELR